MKEDFEQSIRDTITSDISAEARLNIEAFKIKHNTTDIEKVVDAEYAAQMPPEKLED
jgi:hypothetical protein